MRLCTIENKLSVHICVLAAAVAATRTVSPKGTVGINSVNTSIEIPSVTWRHQKTPGMVTVLPATVAPATDPVGSKTIRLLSNLKES
ncbi:MAG: hypothetical protein V9E88_18940 [Ferruginibacter sp.]